MPDIYTMNTNLFFEPDGSLICSGGSEDLQEAFRQSGGDGLLVLAFAPLPDDAMPFTRFCREKTREMLQEYLRSGKADDFPDPQTADAWAESAPVPERGETLSPALIGHFCGLIRTALKKRAGTAIRDYLIKQIPEWKDLGRITFHLAENKKDPDGRHPFVFLATFPDRTGESGELRHVPLASAFKLYAHDKNLLAGMMQQLQKAAGKAPFLDSMLKNRTLFKPCSWTPHEAFLFVRTIRICQEAGILVRLNKGNSVPKRLKVNVTVDATPRRKGMPLTETILRFSPSVAAGDRILTQEELAEILKTGGGLIRVKGEWIEADTDQVAELLHRWEQASALADMADIPFLCGLRIISGVKGGKGAIQGSATAWQMPEDPEELCEFKPGPALTDFLNGMKSLTVPALPENMRLRPYQQEGVCWLYKMGALSMGGCLADDMGLGKTIQVLAFLEILRREGELAPVCALAVVPASLLRNWQAEAEKFTPLLRTRILHPSEGVMEGFRADPGRFLASCDLVVTSYGMVLRLLEKLSCFHYPVILLDEAQTIKNGFCQQSNAVRKLRGTRRFALTGTPVENSPADLWSIFDFLNPGLLGSSASFRETLKSMAGGKDGKCDYAPLRRLVTPCILRRVKTDKRIIQDLPDKTEIRTWCYLTDVQLKIYQRAVEEMRKELMAAEEERRNGIILSFLMQFKQICNHPTQFTGLGEYSVERSGKFQRLAELAESIARRGDKMLVFTQFKEIIPPIHDLLASVFQRKGLILHGGTPVAERTRSVQEFQAPGGPPFFVLSLRAAGTGLTLTAANHVVHFDRWWNPAVENQATDRAYRIGQKRNVLVHKFVCRGTLEERIDSLIRSKTFLAADLLASGPEKHLTEMSNDELLAFVRPEEQDFS